MTYVPNTIADGSRSNGEKVKENFDYLYDNICDHPYFCRVSRSSTAQVINDNTLTVVQFNAVNQDPNSNWDAVNYRYTVPVNGYYMVLVQTRLVDATHIFNGYLRIALDATAMAQQIFDDNDALAYMTFNIMQIVYATAGQNIDARALANSDDSSTINVASGSDETYMMIWLVRYA